MKNLPTINTILSQEIDPAFSQRARFIIETISKEKPLTILDTGCGRGFYPKLVSLLPFPKKIIGIDISETYVKKAQALTKNDPRVTIQQASIYKIPLKNASVDCVICSEVFEHLDKPEEALTEINRVLKPHGILLATVPHSNFPFFWDPLNFILMKLLGTHIDKNIWWLAGIWADHERLYSEKEFVSFIGKKLKVETTKRIVATCWPFTHFFLYAIGKNIVERLNGKEFDRFNFTDKPFSAFLASMMRLPTLLKKNISKDDRYMNIAIATRKMR